MPFTGPIPAGQPRPYVDPANGRIVVPRPGPWAIGKQPWDYADGSPAPTVATQPRHATAGGRTQPVGQNPYVPTTPPADTVDARRHAVGAGAGAVHRADRRRPAPAYVDPANGRIVVPAMGPYATGKRPWVYQN